MTCPAARSLSYVNKRLLYFPCLEQRFAREQTVRKGGRRFRSLACRPLTHRRCRFSPNGQLGHPSAQGAQKPVKGLHGLAAVDEHGERSDGTHRPLSGAMCPICGKVFVRFTSNRLYCSRVCHNRSESMQRRRQLEMLFVLPDRNPTR
jgi:hypothetical protein